MTTTQGGTIMTVILRNYNKFLIGAEGHLMWEDFYIHRFDTDFKKLVKFESKEDAQSFLDRHSELETNFDAWIVETNSSDWV